MSKSRDCRTSDFVLEIASKVPSDGVTFRGFLEILGDHGALLSCLILVAPFLLPVSIPGSSLPFGLVIILVNMGVLFNRRPLIPGFVMNYEISQENMVRILKGMARVLSGLEKFSKPRFFLLAKKTVMKYVNSLMIIFCAFLLMLPLPVPLTDFLPAYGILFLAVGSLERDGYMILAGYFMVALTTLYFALIILLGWSGVKVALSYLGIPL